MTNRKCFHSFRVLFSETSHPKIEAFLPKNNFGENFGIIALFGESKFCVFASSVRHFLPYLYFPGACVFSEVLPSKKTWFKKPVFKTNLRMFLLCFASRCAKKLLILLIDAELEAFQRNFSENHSNCAKEFK